MKNRNRIILKIAVLCTAIPDIGAGAATASLNAIMQAMPEVPVSIVQMIVTIPSLFLTICSPLYAKSTQYLKKKKLLTIAFVLYIVGGLGPSYLNDIYLILACRALLGIASAIMMPITTDMIVDFFEGNEKRTMLGFAACISSIGGIVFQALGGILGNINWHYCFYANLFALPFFIFSFIFLPEPERKISADGCAAKVKMRVPVSAWLLVVFMAVWEMMLFVFLTTSSIVIVGENVADTAAAGVTVSLFSVGGLILSFIYGKVHKILKKFTLPIAYIISAFGLLLFCVANDIVVFHISAFLLGLGYGLCTPASFNTFSEIAPDAKTAAVSYGYTAKGIGGFLCPFVFGAIHSALGTQMGRSTFIMATAVLFILAVLMMIYVNFVFGKTREREAIKYEG